MSETEEVHQFCVEHELKHCHLPGTGSHLGDSFLQIMHHDSSEYQTCVSDLCFDLPAVMEVVLAITGCLRGNSRGQLIHKGSDNQQHGTMSVDIGYGNST